MKSSQLVLTRIEHLLISTLQQCRCVEALSEQGKKISPHHILRTLGRAPVMGQQLESSCFVLLMRCETLREISNLTLTSELARMFTATATGTWATPVAFANLIEEDFFQNKVRSEDADDLRQHFASVDQKLIGLFH